MEWKEEELRNFTYDSKQSSDHKYFVCQHDGLLKLYKKAAELERKASRKFRRSQVKSKSFCPSKMTCHINKATNAVRVEYISAQ